MTDDKVTNFCFTNDLMEISQNEFLKRWDIYKEDQELTDEDMKEWSENFSTFLSENRTFELDNDRNILMQKYSA